MAIHIHNFAAEIPGSSRCSYQWFGRVCKAAMLYLNVLIDVCYLAAMRLSCLMRVTTHTRTQMGRSTSLNSAAQRGKGQGRRHLIVLHFVRIGLCSLAQCFKQRLHCIDDEAMALINVVVAQRDDPECTAESCGKDARLASSLGTSSTSLLARSQPSSRTFMASAESTWQ